jgi:ubiquitin carboxyl-terminal hydrolase L3
MSTNEWRAIESNPEVMTALAHKLGLPSTWAVHDVYSFDEELLGMVPQPVMSLQLIFGTEEQYSAPPINNNSNAAESDTSNLFFLEQVDALPNACGTIALVHGMANNMQALGVADDSMLGRFVAANRARAKREIGDAMATDAELREAHNSFVEQGQSRVVSNDERVGAHFIALLPIDGRVVEFDGAYQQAPVVRDAIAEARRFCRLRHVW